MLGFLVFPFIISAFVAVSDSRDVLIPQVSTNSILAYSDNTHYAGSNRDFPATVIIKITQVSQTTIGFDYSSERALRKTHSSLTLDRKTLSLSPSGSAFAPFSFTRDFFGDPPRDFAPGKSWTIEMPRSVLGEKGTLTVRVVSLNQATSDCTLGLQYASTSQTDTKLGDKVVEGTLRRESRGTVTIHRGVITEMRVHGVDRESFPGQSEATVYFERVRKLK